MALYGYTIGDVDVNPNLAGEQFEVYRFLIPVPPVAPAIISSQLVGTVTVSAALASNPDLEGLGTSYTSGRVSAVNEPGTNPTTIRVGPVDAPFGTPITVTPTRTSNVDRYGDETGADFGRDFSITTSNTQALYALGADSTPGAVGTSVYRISIATPGTIRLLDTATPTAAELAGTTPTNPGRYADGLAIDNLTQGRYRALASDFTTVDGDLAQLHKVDLLTGQLSAPIQLIDSNTNLPLSVNYDSGLAFTRVPFPGNTDTSAQRLIALLENGFLYEITGYQDELSASGLSLGSATGTNGAGSATATLIGVVNLPNALSGVADYEGFAITNETVNG
ncbi:hypothetical protein LC593_30610 [Nostoc sp. CHAB 5844]|nr:hypothetical protein [Nostoc sp. CHAB 5844]